MSIFNYKQRNNIVLGGVVVLGCFLLYALSGLFSSILGAIVLFTMFRPVFLFLTEKKGWSKALVAVMIMVVSLVLIIIPLMSVSIMVVNKLSGVSRHSLHIEMWI